MNSRKPPPPPHQHRPARRAAAGGGASVEREDVVVTNERFERRKVGRDLAVAVAVFLRRRGGNATFLRRVNHLALPLALELGLPEEEVIVEQESRGVGL